VDEPYEEIAGWLKKGVIDLVQLHGEEDEYYIRQLRKVMLFQDTLVPVIQAFRVKTEEDILRAGHSIADYILLDSGAGSGAAFDWSLIKKINRPYFLAGGLGPDNVAEAIRRFHPYAVDMSSSLETDRKKDPEKIQRAVREARNAAG
jgi:phosphoribosylanthranilate isomerase